VLQQTAGFDPGRFWRRFAAQGHNGLLQLQYVSHGADHVVLMAPCLPELVTPGEMTLADGVLITLLDMAGTLAVWTRLGHFRPNATLDLRVDHLEAIRVGVEIKAYAECYHLNEHVAYVRGHAYIDRNATVAALSATYAFTGHA
jgi:acyl-coenzyme A thioesterase PaaI-like protein